MRIVVDISGDWLMSDEPGLWVRLSKVPKGLFQTICAVGEARVKIERARNFRMKNSETETETEIDEAIDLLESEGYEVVEKVNAKEVGLIPRKI